MKILCTERDGRWVAHAVREETGARPGKLVRGMR